MYIDAIYALFQYFCVSTSINVVVNDGILVTTDISYQT